MPDSEAAGTDRHRARGSAENAESAELAEVRAQLREARQMIGALRAGSTDSGVIGPPGQERVYALTTADRTYRLIVEAMSEGAAIISPRGVILDANPRLGAMTGRTAIELVGAPVLDLAPDTHRAAFARLLDVSIDHSGRGETALRGPGGTTIPVLLSVGGFDLDDMTVRCLILTDLTAQRTAEAQVRTLNAELEERVRQRTTELERANENLETFSYSVSHDLRAPLRALSGFSEALVEECGDLLDEEGRGYAARIQAASERMTVLIEDLLHLSRVSRAQMHPEPVNLSAEVADIAAELRARDPARRVRLAVQDGVWASADRALIRTVVQNLLENAWKFTAHRVEAVIEFSGEAGQDGQLRCHVRDNGAGFDPAYAAKLFRPFERLHSTADFPGTGIGLASVRRIIERHGGRTWAEGATGEGATFSFTLAAASGPSNQPHGRPLAREQASGSS
jgi:PAS domain S-box-containing protein